MYYRPGHQYKRTHASPQGGTPPLVFPPETCHTNSIGNKHMKALLLAVFTLITIPVWGGIAGAILGLLIQNPVLWVITAIALFYILSNMK